MELPLKQDKSSKLTERLGPQAPYVAKPEVPFNFENVENLFTTLLSGLHEELIAIPEVTLFDKHSSVVSANAALSKSCRKT